MAIIVLLSAFILVLVQLVWRSGATVPPDPRTIFDWLRQLGDADRALLSGADRQQALVMLGMQHYSIMQLQLLMLAPRMDIPLLREHDLDSLDGLVLEFEFSDEWLYLLTLFRKQALMTKHGIARQALPALHQLHVDIWQHDWRSDFDSDGERTEINIEDFCDHQSREQYTEFFVARRLLWQPVVQPRMLHALWEMTLYSLAHPQWALLLLHPSFGLSLEVYSQLVSLDQSDATYTFYFPMSPQMQTVQTMTPGQWLDGLCRRWLMAPFVPGVWESVSLEQLLTMGLQTFSPNVTSGQLERLICLLQTHLVAASTALHEFILWASSTPLPDLSIIERMSGELLHGPRTATVGIPSSIWTLVPPLSHSQTQTCPQQ
jgi:hypothetical protein